MFTYFYQINKKKLFWSLPTQSENMKLECKCLTVNFFLQIFSNVMLHRLILSLQVFCSNENIGCRWIGEVSQIEVRSKYFKHIYHYIWFIFFSFKIKQEGLPPIKHTTLLTSKQRCINVIWTDFIFPWTLAKTSKSLVIQNLRLF